MAFSDLSSEDKQSIIEHLEELRKSLIISVVAILAAAIVCFYYNEDLLALIIAPLRGLNETLVVTGVTEAFFVKLKLSLLAGFVVAFPIVAWAVWRFFKPAFFLRKNMCICYSRFRCCCLLSGYFLLTLAYYLWY